MSWHLDPEGRLHFQLFAAIPLIRAPHHQVRFSKQIRSGKGQCFLWGGNPEGFAFCFRFTPKSYNKAISEHHYAFLTKKMLIRCMVAE